MSPKVATFTGDNEMNDNTKVFSTDNMALAAYLSINGQEIVGTTWRGGRLRQKCYWEFNNTYELEDLVSDFALGDALVDPKLFNERILELKQDMFHEKDSQPAS